MRPLLLLDIDGPLNPFRAAWFKGRVPAQGYDFHDLTPEGGVTYRVARNQDHGRQICVLAELGFEPVWASTWLEDANGLVSPLLGLPTDLAVVPLARPRIARGKRCWKAPQIAEWVGDRPFAWFDDEINRATRDWLANAGLAKNLAHRVEPHIGLTDDDFGDLRAFVEGL